MKIALIQTDIIWEDADQNRKNFEEKINTIASDVDLIILPEMFTTGFSMHPEALAETMKGESVLWLQHLAKAKNAAITGSLIIKENDRFYNRLVFVFPSGEIQFYDKRHLFSLAGEDELYSAGAKKLIVEYKGWKICPLICYDLRFPVFSRNTEDYDLLIYAANWPTTRILAWDTLLKARAIENMCYTIGVNRIGKDGNDHPYSGHTQVVDFLGNSVIEPSEKEIILIAELDKQQLLETRKKLDFLNDRDVFEIKDSQG
ncbi:putative amidohydrolase [Flavobacterium arsenatis]|uniref:Amidohydrolase n=1 Tax=Flavobacterium arsenatis TaxID=1484332 RepID=A0ABU1TTH0_9FLAO|nr:amidohydrolase [Flavobacterium arsenatis]MDR6969147.1 putative amidohydrolase [Flavobacterium arsenatis]